jgi:leucyl aminopeptidase
MENRAQNSVSAWHNSKIASLVIAFELTSHKFAGNAVAYSTTYSILAVAVFNDQSDKFFHSYNLKGFGSVYIYTRQNTNAPANALTPHNQFIFHAKLNSTDSSYIEYQRNHFGARPCLMQVTV